MFSSNPPQLPPWPRWIEPPGGESITINGRFFLDGETIITFVLSLVVAIMTAMAVDLIDVLHHLVIDTIIARQPTLNPSIVEFFTSASAGMVCGCICGPLFWPVSAEFSGEKTTIRFFLDRIEIKGVFKWEPFPRAATDRLKFFAKRNTAEGNDFTIYMRFGLNRVRLASFEQDRARNFVALCRAANDASLHKGIQAFGVVQRVRPVVPVEVLDDRKSATGDD